jgi:hypothetical protein
MKWRKKIIVFILFDLKYFFKTLHENGRHLATYGYDFFLLNKDPRTGSNISGNFRGTRCEVLYDLDFGPLRQPRLIWPQLALHIPAATQGHDPSIDLISNIQNSTMDYGRK